MYEHVQKLALSFPLIVRRLVRSYRAARMIQEAIKDFYVSVLSTFVKNIVFLVGILVAMFLSNVKLALFSRINSDRVCDYGAISPEKCSFLFRSP